MQKKKVLLLSEGFGTGHTQAARALSASLNEHSPHVETTVMELGAYQHPWIGPLILGAYRRTLISQPKLIGALYHAKYDHSISPLTEFALHRIFYARSARIVEQQQPDVIVCTHPFPNMIISRLKRAGLNMPLVTVITDYDAHASWLSSETSGYLVSTNEVKQKLLERNVPEHLIFVTGIPVHPKFHVAHDRQEIRRKFNLKPLPTVLIMGGGWGILKHTNSLTHILDWKDKIQFIYCMGNNEKALRKMASNPLFDHPNIRLLGYTDQIAELMEVSDLLITKPGGITCSEGLAKGIPMLLYNPFPGQEERNCEYFISQGFAERLQHTHQLTAWFTKLVEHSSTLDDMRSQLNDNKYDRLATVVEPILRLIS